MRHLGLEIHRLEKMMARRRGYSAAHQDADRLTGMHGYLIRYLYENRGRDVFQRDIEKAFSISRSTVTVTLQLMEKNGLICRESVAQDARLKRLILTEEGGRVHEKTMLSLHQTDEFVAGLLTEEENAELLRLLNKLRKGLE